MISLVHALGFHLGLCLALPNPFPKVCPISSPKPHPKVSPICTPKHNPKVTLYSTPKSLLIIYRLAKVLLEVLIVAKTIN